jgi:hypothetical protein
MIELPDFAQDFQWENNFYLSCKSARMGKMIAHYELFKMARDVPGAIAECGVFKGASFSRFAMFRDLFGNAESRTLIGFDTFDEFPLAASSSDAAARETFVSAAGSSSISREQLLDVLARKGCDASVELVAGDVCETVPAYVRDHPELKISLLNLDIDVYEPSVTILEHLYPRVQSGGVVVLDDYGFFPGETQAVDEYFADMQIEIRKFPFAMRPCYFVKP